MHVDCGVHRIIESPTDQALDWKNHSQVTGEDGELSQENITAIIMVG